MDGDLDPSVHHQSSLRVSKLCKKDPVLVIRALAKFYWNGPHLKRTVLFSERFLTKSF